MTSVTGHPVPHAQVGGSPATSSTRRSRPSASRWQRWRRLPATLLALALAATAAVALPATASAAPRDSIDAQFVQLANQARSQAGLAPLVHSADLRRLSTYWSDRMATGGTSCRLAHNPDAWNQLPSYGAASRTKWGENVASWTTDQYSAQDIFNLYMESPGHRANILGKDYRYIGVATVSGSGGCAGTDWNTMTFTDKVDNPGNVVGAPTGGNGGGTTTPAPNSMKIGIRSLANGKYVTAEQAGTQSLIANRDSVGLWETFTITTTSGDQRTLKAAVDNEFVCAEAAGTRPLIANRGSAGVWETYALVTNPDGSFSFRAFANNKFVTAEAGGSQPLIANRDSVGQWEKFQFVAVG